MKNATYVPDYPEEPDLDSERFRPFRANFQKSILLSLLERKILTQAQYERCLEKLMQDYAGDKG